MREEAKRHGSPAPVFEATGFFTAIFRPLATSPRSRTEQVTGQVEGQVAGQVTVEIMKMLKAMSGDMTRIEIQTALKLKGRANFEGRYLKPALALGLLEMTIPDRPRNRMQKYQLTPAGRSALKKSAQ